MAPGSTSVIRNGRSDAADASGMTLIRVLPYPFGANSSTAMATSILPNAPRPRGLDCSAPRNVSSTSTRPDSGSRPGQTIAVR